MVCVERTESAKFESEWLTVVGVAGVVGVVVFYARQSLSRGGSL